MEGNLISQKSLKKKRMWLPNKVQKLSIGYDMGNKSTDISEATVSIIYVWFQDLKFG